MLSRIDDPLGLMASGSVQVCGPIRWEANEQSAEFGFILHQEDRLLVGRSSANRGDVMWMGTNLRRTGGAFQPGSATGTIVAVVRRNTAVRPVITASWTQDVLLQ